MNITMKHIGRDDAVEVAETDSLAIGRFLLQGYKKVSGHRPAPPAVPHEPVIPPPSAAREDDE